MNRITRSMTGLGALVLLSCAWVPDVSLAASVNAICVKAKKTIKIPRGLSYLVVRTEHSSDCPVAISGAGLEGSIPQGTTQVRPIQSDAAAEIELNCGNDEKMKCAYTYTSGAAANGATKLDENTVKNKCDKSETTLDLGAGSYILEVDANNDSDCPVNVESIPNKPNESLDPGKDTSTLFAVPAGQTAKIIIGCGNDANKTCHYSYTLSRSAGGHVKPKKH